MFRKASFYQKLYTLMIMAAFMYYLQYWIRLLTQESIPTFHKWLKLPDEPMTTVKPRQTKKPASAPVKEKAAAGKATKTTKTGEKQDAAARDDLKAIEGIGPKSEQVLYAAGITTYSKMASMNADALRQVLKEGNINANPETWSDQAKLANAGEWDALQKLQAQLKGGLKS